MYFIIQLYWNIDYSEIKCCVSIADIFIVWSCSNLHTFWNIDRIESHIFASYHELFFNYYQREYKYSKDSIFR